MKLAALIILAALVVWAAVHAGNAAIRAYRSSVVTRSVRLRSVEE